MLLSKRIDCLPLLLVSALSWNACNGGSEVRSVQPREDGGGAAGGQTSPVAEASAGAAGQATEAAAPDVSDRDALPESGSDTTPDAAIDGSVGDANGETSVDAAGDASDGTLSDMVIVGFDSSDDLSLFRFFTPEPYSPGPGNWVWVPLPDPHLAQMLNMTSGIGPVVTGTNAIYQGGTFRDARVSVRIWTTDVTGGAGILARYVDDTHYYRLGISTTGVSIHKHDGDSFQLLGCQTSVPLAGCVDNPAIYNDLTYSGETITFEFVGPVLRAYGRSGVLLLEVTDSAFREGQVGLYCRAMYNANFDNFFIDPLDPAFDAQ